MRRQRIVGLLLLGLVALPLTARAEHGDCSQPVSTGNGPSTVDCLYILRTAVNSVSCDPCICDVNSAGGITTLDALLCLRRAVGQDILLNCSFCATTTSSSTSTTSTSTSTSTSSSFPAFDRCDFDMSCVH